MFLRTSRWSAWSRGGETCSWTTWVREVPGIELEDSVQQAEQSGLSADGACRLRDILPRRVDAFRRVLRGDPPARGAHESSPEATGAGRESQTSPVRSCEDRVVSVVHRGFGGVWFDRVEHPGRVG